jgi:hypothetical protein
MIDEDSPYFAKNCYTCMPPEGCPYPRPQGDRAEDCPSYNRDIQKTTTSTECPDRDGELVRMGICADCGKKKNCHRWKMGTKSQKEEQC